MTPRPPEWMTLASGRRYRLEGVDLDPITLPDVAHHLAQLNRYTGAAIRPISVAEHSLLVEYIACMRGGDYRVRYGALMHDAHEAVTNDVSSPAKKALRRLSSPAADPWAQFEKRHADHVRQLFGLTEIFAEHGDEIHACDLIALATERRDLMPDADGEEWEVLRDVEPLDTRFLVTGAGICWTAWRDEFRNAVTGLAFNVDGQP